jgi:hypothetical protein
VRSVTAIIFLTTFFALQYGKLASYWHCRFVSLYSSTPCDCVQQLLDAHKDGDGHTPTTLKEKTEDIVLFYETVQSWQSPVLPVTVITAYPEDIPETFTSPVFQPPRIMLNA